MTEHCGLKWGSSFFRQALPIQLQNTSVPVHARADTGTTLHLKCRCPSARTDEQNRIKQNRNNQRQTNERFNVGFSSGHGRMTSGGWRYLECRHTIAKGRLSAPFFSGHGTLQQAASSLLSCCSLVTDWMCVLSY